MKQNQNKTESAPALAGNVWTQGEYSNVNGPAGTPLFGCEDASMRAALIAEHNSLAALVEALLPA